MWYRQLQTISEFVCFCLKKRTILQIQGSVRTQPNNCSLPAFNLDGKLHKSLVLLSLVPHLVPDL